MRTRALSILEIILRFLTKRTLERYKPRVIGITGSVGKTSTKTAIYTVLDKGADKKVRVGGGNLNNELGLPLTVLGEYDASGGAMFWLGVILKATFRLLFVWSDKDYPDVLILEYGADKPGDIKKLIEIAKPDVGVITAIGRLPVHVEFYNSPEEVAKEKATLINSLGASSHAVLNIDDPSVHGMRETALTEVLTYGLDSSADVRIDSFENINKNGKPYGLRLSIGADGNRAIIIIDGVFGKSQAYAAAAATVVGLIEGLNLNKIAESLALYEGEKGRTRLISGIKGSFIIDDTYNASPLSGSAALEILEDLDSKRKIAVLGDMLELGKYTEEAHLDLGEHVAGVADYLVTVGARARFIAQGAKDKGMDSKMIESFDSSDDAKGRIQEIMKPGDLVLVKGSQGMRTEKIVLEIMAEPEKAGELLVRQYGKWLNS